VVNHFSADHVPTTQSGSGRHGHRFVASCQGPPVLQLQTSRRITRSLTALVDPHRTAPHNGTPRFIAYKRDDRRGTCDRAIAHKTRHHSLPTLAGHMRIHEALLTTPPRNSASEMTLASNRVHPSSGHSTQAMRFRTGKEERRWQRWRRQIVKADPV
jgi:hypothetical protein